MTLQYRYRFENNIKFIAEYYEKHEEYPSQHSENLEVKKVGGILCYEKIKMRNEKEVYPEWKMKIIRRWAKFVGYRIYNSEKFNEWRCPNKKCGMHISEDYTCCPYCGQKIKFKVP